MLTPMTDVAEVIEALGMEPHPEGGWYVETWRAPAPEGERPAGSAILYLLSAGERSQWHRFDAAEVWQFSAGDALELSVWDGSGPVVRTRLGPDIVGRRSAPGRGARRRVAMRAAGRRVDARRVHRHAGLRLRLVPAGTRWLGAAGLSRSRTRRPRPDQPPSRIPQGDP